MHDRREAQDSEREFKGVERGSQRVRVPAVSGVVLIPDACRATYLYHLWSSMMQLYCAVVTFSIPALEILDCC